MNKAIRTIKRLIGIFMGFCLLLSLPMASAQEIALVEGTTEDMLNASSWVATDEILMSADEIQAFNRQNLPSIIYTDENDVQQTVWFNELGDTMSGSVLAAIIESNHLPKEDKVSYCNGKVVTQAFWHYLDANRNVSSIEEEAPLRFGFSVYRDSLHSFPSDQRITDTPDDLYFNNLMQAEVMANTPVIVAHESTDERWFYVVVGFYAGWVRKEAIAICQSREEWLALCDPESFLVVTENNLILDDNVYQPQLARLELAMGTKVALVDNPPASVGGRAAYGSYVVSLPVRLESGMLQMETALIPVSKDVHVGYVPYTAREELNLMFKFLGQVYGWCGDLHANDCSGTIGQVFRCFGFRFARGARMIVNMNGMRSIALEEKSSEEKLKLIEEAPVGSLLYFPGHITMYLGMRKGVPYVISAAGGFVSSADAGLEPLPVQKANCVMVTNLALLRGNGSSWLENLTVAVYPSGGDD